MNKGFRISKLFFLPIMFRFFFPFKYVLLVNLKQKKSIVDVMPAAEGGSVLSIPLSLFLFVC